MTIFITYCSREKDKSKKELEAIKRYKSNRIQKVYKASKLLTVDFMILSGEFGLLKPNKKIPYYDHLLVESEVSKYIDKITEQLREINYKKIIFFTECLKNDANLKPYQVSIKTACENLNIEFMMVEIEKEVNDL